MMKSILFIEDDPGERHVVKMLYRMACKAFHGEVDFSCAPNWAEGERFVLEQRPDVVLADLAVPPHSADESIALIRVFAPTWPPIVVLTGNEVREEELRTKCIQAGAVDFMMKKKVNRSPEEICERVYIAYLRRVHRG